MRSTPKGDLATDFSPSIDDPEACLPTAQAIFPNTRCASDGMCVTLRYPAH